MSILKQTVNEVNLQQRDAVVEDLHKTIAEILDVDEDKARTALNLVDGLELFSDVDVTQGDNNHLLMPTHVLPTLSQESFSETMDSVWKFIKKWLKRLVDIITSEHLELRTINAAVKYKAGDVKILARKNLSSRTAAGNLTVKHYINPLSTRYRTPRDLGAINGGLLYLKKTLDTYFQYADVTLSRGIGDLNSIVRSINVDRINTEELEQSLISVLEGLVPTKLIPTLGKSQDTGDGVIYGSQLIGNVRLRFKGTEEDNLTLSDINSTRITLALAELTPREQPQSFEISRFSLSTLDQTVKLVTDICTSIDRSLGRVKERQRQIEGLTQTFDRLVSNLENKDDIDTNTKRLLQEVVKLPKTLLAWSNVPYKGLINSALRSMRGALHVCELN